MLPASMLPAGSDGRAGFRCASVSPALAKYAWATRPLELRLAAGVGGVPLGRCAVRWRRRSTWPPRTQDRAESERATAYPLPLAACRLTHSWRQEFKVTGECCN